MFGAAQLAENILPAQGDTIAVSEYQGEQVAALNMAARESGTQSFYFAQGIYGLLGADSQRMTIRFYSDTACSAVLYIVGRNNLAIPVLTADISAGYNELSLAAYGLNWSSIGAPTNMYMRIGEEGDNTARVLRFVEVEIM